MPLDLVAQQVNPYGPLVKFRTQGIFPPTAVYVGPDDAIEFEARSPSVSTVVNVTIRILTPAGEIKAIPFQVTVATSGTAVFTQHIPPTEGFVLTAHVSANNASRGQCFVKMHLIRNPGQSQQILGALLLQGYLSADDNLSYPASGTESSLNQRGWTREITLPNTTMATPPTFTVPAGVRWIVRQAHFAYTADAIGGARTFVLVMIDPTAVQIGKYDSGGSIGVNGFGEITWSPGIAATATGTVLNGPLPIDLVLPAGFKLQLNALGSPDPGDSVSEIAAMVEEFVAQ